MKPFAALHYLRLASFDTRTEQGRQEERYRLAAISILSNVLSRSLGIVLMILSVSLTVPYLGVERFGVWMTVASFAGLLTFLDLGVGNALTNQVAHRLAADDAALLNQTVSGGLALLAIIGMVVGAVLWMLAANLDWSVLVKVEQPKLLDEVRIAAMCFSVLFGLSIFTNGIQRVLAGMQQAYFGHLATAGGFLVSGAGLWIATETQQGIGVLLVIMLGGQCLACLPLLGVLVFRKQFTLDGIAGFARRESNFLLRTGGLFFILQIGTMVGWGADSLIISSTLGVAQVAAFSVVQRLFQFATQPLGILNAPLWGAYADANARNDRRFIMTTLKKSMGITLAGATFGAVVLLAVHPWLIQKWTRGAIVVPIDFVAAYAVWVILDACGNAFAMFLNGTGIVRQQISVVAVFVVLVLPLKFMLVEKMGLLALPLATIAAYLISTVGLYALVFRSDIRQKLA